jgi:hypothetical protein
MNQKWIRTVLGQYRANIFNLYSKQSVVCIKYLDPKFILKDEIYSKRGSTANFVGTKNARLIGTVAAINLETSRFFYCKLFVTLTMLLTYQFRL